MGAPYESGAYGEYRDYLLSRGESNEGAHASLLRSLRAAVREELTARQLETLLLYYSSGMSMSAVARSQGVSVSTVSRSLNRSRRRLEKCLRYGARELLKQSAAGK